MIQDNTTKWKVRKFTDFASNQAMPVGYVHWSISPIVPAGELPLLGGTYDRSLYANLWSWANENGLVISESEWQEDVLESGKCDKFSDGNGSTTFRVPKLPTTITSDVPSEVPVVGNGVSVGFTNGNNNYGLSGNSTAGGLYLNAYGVNVGNSISNGTGLTTATPVGLTTDPTKSGIVAKTSATKITGQWLIVAFGVAHNIGEADVANVMQAVEQVQTSVGTLEQGVGTLEQGVGTAIDYIIESYRNGTEWYEVYKSGKVRQGGRKGANNNVYITFLKPFANTNYTVLLTSNMEDGSYAVLRAYNMSKTKFEMQMEDTGMVGGWVAEGQGA